MSFLRQNSKNCIISTLIAKCKPGSATVGPPAGKYLVPLNINWMHILLHVRTACYICIFICGQPFLSITGFTAIGQQQKIVALREKNLSMKTRRWFLVMTYCNPQRSERLDLSLDTVPLFNPFQLAGFK